MVYATVWLMRTEKSIFNCERIFISEASGKIRVDQISEETLGNCSLLGIMKSTGSEFLKELVDNQYYMSFFFIEILIESKWSFERKNREPNGARGK